MTEMHLPPLIVDLAIILAVAGLMSFVFQKLKQPVVLGYILAGVIVGPYTPPFQLVRDLPSIQTLAELGVIFLMFTLGLEFSFRKLLSVGFTAGIAATLEVVFFLFVGYGIGIALGWSKMDSIFLGAMLSISSTTIIIKALDDLKLKSSRFAGLIFGILIVEDLFAILLLVGLSTIATTNEFSVMSLASTSLNLLVVVGSWFIVGYLIVPRVISYVGKKGNAEMLTLVSTGLCLSLVVIAVSFGYSAALGAFIMGSILAETKLIHEIETLMAPLKDIFGAIFFVSIGLMINPHIIWEYKEAIAILCVVTIFGKIFITSSGALISGQNFKNSLQVGMGLAQIGEFSFIIAGLGVSLKATSEKLYPIGVAVSLITTFTTPYLIQYSGPVAGAIEKRLPWWLREALGRYSDWCNYRSKTQENLRQISPILARWLMNGIAMTFVFRLSFKYLIPSLSYYVVWLIAFALSLPLIWGMVFSSKHIRDGKNVLNLAIVSFLPVLTSIWIAVLSARYIAWAPVVLATIIFLAGAYFLLFKRLEIHYSWLEETFLHTFKDKAREAKENLAQLAPWDSHLVSIRVHPNSQLANHTLLQANLRHRFGVNIVAIERGVHTIIAPKPGESILPADNLIVLGTDEQLTGARPELEVPSVTPNIPDSSSYKLRHFTILFGTKFAGKSIRDSEIRDHYHAMVVGIERAKKRIINPDTDFVFMTDDIVWVVGEQELVGRLLKEAAQITEVITET